VSTESRAAKHPEHASGDAIVALIVIEPGVVLASNVSRAAIQRKAVCFLE
jgi:hypothetical protein